MKSQLLLTIALLTMGSLALGCSCCCREKTTCCPKVKTECCKEKKCCTCRHNRCCKSCGRCHRCHKCCEGKKVVKAEPAKVHEPAPVVIEEEEME